MAEQNVNLILKQEEQQVEDEVVVSLSAIFRKLKKYFTVWLLVSIIIGGLISGISVFFKTTTSSPVQAVVSFNYSGIEKGRNPDGSKFDYSSLKNPQIIEQALTECDMSLNLLETIRRSIDIEGKIPEDAYQRLNTYRNVLEASTNNQLAAANAMLDVSWYSTQYNITFNYKNAKITRSEAVQFLNAMLDAYNDYFFDKYGYNEALGNSLAAMDYTDYDYAEAVDMFRVTLRQLNRYVANMDASDSNRFRSTVTGYTFADLKAAINSIQSLDLDLIASYLSVNNITKDKERLKAYYEYRIQNLERQKTADTEILEAVQSAFDAYEKDQVIIFSDSVADTETTLASEEYDKLINRRISAQTELSETNQDIKYYEERLQTLKKSTMGSEDKAERVEKDLEKLNDKVNDMIKIVEETADDYYQNVSFANAYNILVPATSEASATIKGGIMAGIVPCFGAEAIWFVIYLGLAFVKGVVDESNRRKEKRQQAAAQAASPQASDDDKKNHENNS